MKKLSLLVLTIAFVFTVSVVEVYAATTITTAGTGSTGDILIASGTFSGQTANLTFTTSVNVYVGFTVTTGSTGNAENYTVNTGHLNGDKEFAMANSGGGLYWITRTPGTASINSAPAITSAGVVSWGTFAPM